MTQPDGDRPAWWETSAAIKRDLGLPQYEPPVLKDGTYVHEIVDELERSRDCRIQFGAVNPTYPDDWYVWVDGERAFPIGRRRTGDANTVYEMTRAEFESAVESYLEDV